MNENNKGVIDTVFRVFAYSARQAIQEFGENNVSTDILDSVKSQSTQDTKFEFLHAVFPRIEYDKSKKTPEHKKYASIYVEIKSKKIVFEGGYDTFPYCVPRFYDNDELYGRSPAMDAEPALKAINIASWTFLKNVEGQSKPIVFASTEIYQKISLEFGAVNAWDSSLGDIKIWTPVGDPKSPLEYINMAKESVRMLFYNDVFQYLEDKKNMTATEAQLRYDEMIQGISPVLSNLHSEFFAPFIKRVFLALCAKGKIVVPEQYRDEDGGLNTDFEVVYNTRLDTKLKGVLSANIVNFVRLAGEVLTVISQNPQLSAVTDVVKIVKILANNNNVSNEMLKSDDDANEALSAMAEQAKQQQLMEMIEKIDLQKTPENGSAQAAMTQSM